VEVRKGEKSQEEMLTAMKNEVQLQQSFNHRQIVRLFWHETTEKSTSAGRVLRLEIALEFMGGGSVSDLLCHRRQGLEEEVLRRYTWQLVLGVAHLHNRLCAHRDLKCDNLLLSRDEQVLKIADFGLAQRLSSPDALLPAAGTYEWQAPEVLVARRGGLPADVWSLGCSVWEMASSDVPWAYLLKSVDHSKDKGGKRDAILKQLRAKVGQQRAAPQLPKRLSATGRQFVRGCLAHSATFRPTAVKLLDTEFVEPADPPRARVRKRSDDDAAPAEVRKRTRDLNADLALL